METLIALDAIAVPGTDLDRLILPAQSVLLSHLRCPFAKG